MTSAALDVAHADLSADLLEDLASKELARRSLLDFCIRTATVDGEPYVQYRHSLKVIEYLEALERYAINKLIITMPTQHGKSYHSSERFPAFYLGRHPKDHVIVASYGQARANDASRKVRNIVESQEWPFSGIRVASDSSAVAQWALNTGGQVKAAGVDAALGGFGGHLLVLDDPHKDWSEAESTVISDATWNWFGAVFMRRQRRNARILIPTTRWNDRDVVGRILNTPDGKNWTLLELPGFADPTERPDAIGRAKGDVLWPEGPPLPRPETGEISRRQFDALVQQRPTARDGAIFKRPWFDLNERYNEPPPFSTTVAALDGAWKEGVGNSRSAITLWGKARDGYYPLHAWADRVEYPDLKAKVLSFVARHRPRKLLIEDAASGMALIQELRRSTSISIIGVPAKGSKESRAEAASAAFEGGRIHLPAEGEWVDEWIEEHIRFPAKPNDLVDTTSIALEHLGRSASWSPESV